MGNTIYYCIATIEMPHCFSLHSYHCIATLFFIVQLSMYATLLIIGLAVSICHTYHRACNQINTTGVTSGAGTAYPTGAPEFTPGFQWCSCYSIFGFICIFCRSLFVFLYFFFWPLCCLFFFDIGILINPLVSSNSSCYHFVGLCQTMYHCSAKRYVPQYNLPTSAVPHSLSLFIYQYVTLFIIDQAFRMCETC